MKERVLQATPKQGPGVVPPSAAFCAGGETHSPGDVSRFLHLSIPDVVEPEMFVSPGFRKLLRRVFYQRPTGETVQLPDAYTLAQRESLKEWAAINAAESESQRLHRDICAHCYGKDSVPFYDLARNCPVRGANA